MGTLRHEYLVELFFETSIEMVLTIKKHFVLLFLFTSFCLLLLLSTPLLIWLAEFLRGYLRHRLPLALLLLLHLRLELVYLCGA